MPNIFNANGIGQLARGSTQNDGAIEVSAEGGMASGFSINDGSIIKTTALGAHAFGCTQSGGVIDSSGEGGIAGGQAITEGLIQTVASTSHGCLAFGGAANHGVIRADGAGAVAGGFAQAVGLIKSFGVGSLAFGYTDEDGSEINSSGQGSIAFGDANTSGKINSSGGGSFAQGFVDETGDITSSGNGCFAGGRTSEGSVTISSDGALAYGDNLDVSADYAQALGQGHANTSDACLAAGTYSVVTGTPGSPAASDTLFVCGNGVSGTPSNALELLRSGKLKTSAARVDKIRVVTGDDLLSALGDYKIVVDTSGTGNAWTVTLPPGEEGLSYKISNNAGGGTDTYTLVPDSGDTLNSNVATALGSNIQEVTYSAGVWYRF